MKKPLSRRQRDFNVNNAELLSGNRMRVEMQLPTLAWNEWKRRKHQGLTPAVFARIAGELLVFLLYGPHPFSSPADAWTDLLAVYQREKLSDREALAKSMKDMCRKLGLDIEIKNLDDS
jgi:hypothetical protein